MSRYDLLRPSLPLGCFDQSCINRPDNLAFPALIPPVSILCVKLFSMNILKSYTKTKATYNRPFYRYGGHIELIQFKEYYRMPREHERISFVFSSAFRDIFS